MSLSHGNTSHNDKATCGWGIINDSTNLQLTSASWGEPADERGQKYCPRVVSVEHFFLLLVDVVGVTACSIGVYIEKNKKLTGTTGNNRDLPETIG